jgi:VCBS repeat-containing protein
LGVSAVDGSAANVGHSVAGTYGSLALNADGSYVYAANKGSLPAKIVAQDAFQYTVSDPHGGTDTATLYVVVFNPGTNYIAGINTTLNGDKGPDVVDGFAGHNIVLGGNGPDVLIGGNGDTLTGGNGPDTYLFRPGFGTNTITDFDIHNDNIQFDESIFTSAADILAHHTTDTAAGAVISDGLGDTITLLGVHQSQLSAGMLLLA